MLSVKEASDMIESGKTLHIAGSARVLELLPKGNWIGGSTEYFITADSAVSASDMLFVGEMPEYDYKITSYDEHEIYNITGDAYENGFSVVILPLGSDVFNVYATHSSELPGIFVKNIAGWVAGSDDGKGTLVVNGVTGECFSDRAVAMHISLPEGKLASVGIVNIFEPDADSPLFEFDGGKNIISKCRIDGVERIFKDYLTENNVDIRLPIIGEYSGAHINISFGEYTDDGSVVLRAPVFKGIHYRLAKPMPDYEGSFRAGLSGLESVNPVFACNCVHNFIHGKLEGKPVASFAGPVTYGEIAYQLVNQTLVYIDLLDA